MTTQCQIVVATKDNVLTIPNSALKWVDNQQTVFLVHNGKARRAEVELGLAGLSDTEVLSGLTAGQQVATQIVLPGAAKKPSPSQPQPAAPAKR